VAETGVNIREEATMLRKAVCAVAVVAFSVGLAVAADIRGVITKVSDDGKTITVKEFDKETKKFGDAKDYTVAASLKVLKGKRNPDTKKLEAGEELSGGLTNDMFKNIGKRGVFASITTDDSGNVTQIIAGGGRGKGGKRKNKTD
jgi:hypothetical protein